MKDSKIVIDKDEKGPIFLAAGHDLAGAVFTIVQNSPPRSRSEAASASSHIGSVVPWAPAPGRQV